MAVKLYRVSLVLVTILSIVAGVWYAKKTQPVSPYAALTAGNTNGSRWASMRNAGPSPFVTFRNEHKFTYQMLRVVTSMSRLRQGRNQLTPEQAKQLLAIAAPLRQKPTMNQDEAKATMVAMQKVLTIEQRTEIAGGSSGRRRRGGSRGGFPGATGAPAGAPTPGQAPGASPTPSARPSGSATISGSAVSANPATPPPSTAAPRYNPMTDFDEKAAIRFDKFNPFNSQFKDKEAKDVPPMVSYERIEALLTFLEERSTMKELPRPPMQPGGMRPGAWPGRPARD